VDDFDKTDFSVDDLVKAAISHTHDIVIIHVDDLVTAALRQKNADV